MNWYVTALTEESLTPESSIDQSQLSLCLPRPLIGQELCVTASDWSELSPRCVLDDGNQSASWQLGILGKCRHEMTITCHQPIRGHYQSPLTNQRPLLGSTDQSEASV